MSIKELRMSLGLTQLEASSVVHIPLRTYKNYENDVKKRDTIKYAHILKTLEVYGRIDEEHGILTLEAIKNGVEDVFSDYQIDFCYLFGSYAEKTPNEKSDVDLLVSTNLTGLKFFGLVEKLRTTIKKRVDVLTMNQLESNSKLIAEILKHGIKIYG